MSHSAWPTARDLAHRGQLVRPLLGQHGHRDRARLHHGQPAGREPGRGRAAQQDPVAGDDAQVARSGRARSRSTRARSSPYVQDVAGGRCGRRGGRRRAFDGAVQQFGAAVQPVGVAQLRAGRSAVPATPRAAGDGRARRCRRGPRSDVHGGVAPLPFWPVGGGSGRLARRAYRVGDDSQRSAIVGTRKRGDRHARILARSGTNRLVRRAARPRRASGCARSRRRASRATSTARSSPHSARWACWSGCSARGRASTSA